MFVFATWAASRLPGILLFCVFISLPFNAPHAFAHTTLDIPKTLIIGSALGLISTRRMATWWPRSPEFWTFCSLTLAMAMIDATGAFASQDPAAAIRETFKNLESLSAVIVGAALFLREPKAVEYLPRALATLTALVSLTSLMDEFAARRSVFEVGHFVMVRVAGPLEGPNQLAGYLEIFIPPLTLYALSTEPGRERMILYAVAGLGALASILTFSRSGVASLAVATAIVLVFATRQRISLGQTRSRVIAAAMAATAGIVATFSARQAPPIETHELADGLATRSELWHAAVVLFLRRPLFGIGAGNFETSLESTGLLEVRTHANSYYLQTLAETGLVGSAVLGSFVILTLVSLGTRATNNLFTAGIFASTIALFSHQIFDDLFFFPKVGVTWWIMAGLVLAPPIHLKRTGMPRNGTSN